MNENISRRKSLGWSSFYEIQGIKMSSSSGLWSGQTWYWQMMMAIATIPNVWTSQDEVTFSKVSALDAIRGVFWVL